MNLLNELEKENDERMHNPPETKMSDPLSKKYFTRCSGKDSSTVGPIFEVANSAANHKVYDGKYTISNVSSQ